MEVIEVVPSLRMLRFPVGAAYLWRNGDELALIDTGTADCAVDIDGALDGRLRRIVLRHWHEDHTEEPSGGGPDWTFTGPGADADGDPDAASTVDSDEYGPVTADTARKAQR